MKRLITILAAALVGLAACTKIDTAQLDGTYRSTARQEIVIAGGACVSYQETHVAGQPAIGVTGFTTSGRWPNYTYTAKDGITNFTIRAHFLNPDSFTATASGVISDGDASTAIEVYNIEFTRVSANFQQTK